MYQVSLKNLKNTNHAEESCLEILSCPLNFINRSNFQQPQIFSKSQLNSIVPEAWSIQCNIRVARSTQKLAEFRYSLFTYSFLFFPPQINNCALKNFQTRKQSLLLGQ